MYRLDTLLSSFMDGAVIVEVWQVPVTGPDGFPSPGYRLRIRSNNADEYDSAPEGDADSLLAALPHALDYIRRRKRKLHSFLRLWKR
jgi:hypothetical protein